MSKVSPRRLGDLITLKRGYDLPEKDRIPGPYPVISSAGVSGFHHDYKVEGPGVVTGRYGTLGEMYFVDGKYWPHNTALYVQNFKGNDPKYIYYLLSCLGRIRTSDKSAVPGVNRNELHEMAIPAIDDKKLQIAIRKVLEAIDQKIELNNRINAELEAMAKTLYDYWFVQFDFPDACGKPYKTSGGKMVYNPTLKREIPEGWEVNKLSQHLTLGSGFPFDSSTYQENGKYKVITIKNVQSEGLVTDKTDFVDSIPKGLQDFCVLNIGDILMSLTGNVGRVCLVNEEDLLLNQRVGKFVCDKKWKNYFYLYFLRPESRARLEKIATGSSQKNLSPIDAVNFSHVYPSDELLNKFNEATECLIEQIARNSLENGKLASLRDWLLPMLMNGQVTVN